MSMSTAVLMSKLSEEDLQQRITDRANALGWLVYHTHDSRRSTSGFPDLVMSRSGRLLFVEVKTEKGKVSEAQQGWLDNLSQDLNREVYVWRPSHFVLIEKLLA